RGAVAKQEPGEKTIGPRPFPSGRAPEQREEKSERHHQAGEVHFNAHNRREPPVQRRCRLRPALRFLHYKTPPIRHLRRKLRYVPGRPLKPGSVPWTTTSRSDDPRIDPPFTLRLRLPGQASGARGPQGVKQRSTTEASDRPWKPSAPRGLPRRARQEPPSRQ